MAITLRTVTGSALTYEQFDTNFSSFFYSASYSGGTITLYTTGSGDTGSAVPAPTTVSFTIPTISQWTGSVGVSTTDSQIQITGSLLNGSGSISAPNSSFSHGEGFGAIATGLFSHAEGVNNQSTATGSHAEGWTTIASGIYGHSEGVATVARGTGSHAEGWTTVASGSYSHAEGGTAITVGDFSHAEGKGSISIGNYSHTEGDNTQASGIAAHAEGRDTRAVGYASHTEGYATIASGSYQHIQGQFNIPSTVQSAFIIGNGSSDGSRSNLVFASGNQLQVTGSVISTVGFTGSLQGTASYATTSSMTTAITGSEGRIPYFTGGNTLENSNIYQDGGGRIGIGVQPDTSAALHIDSNGGKAGILLPIATTGSIDTPVKGIMIYDSDVDKIAVYTGAAWKYLQYES